ncbi:unnamed protein product [Acanthoscelides obtectus]|uniref:Uncharacterized protein n=1 Tax=Acanthoscelides obtectus TaxID=200917 RepID=A0A9P0QEQ4_ACAOB|nr:unnamed protein product [Acanthoscelides obtectus]CAK1684660.1 hypothetical protein AOBTE_LOCUS35006 [Acanthoscelides obtectus]
MTDTEVNDFLEVIDHDMAQMALDDKVIQNKQEAKDDNEGTCCLAHAFLQKLSPCYVLITMKCVQPAGPS